MGRRFKTAFAVVKASASGWSDDNASTQAAALSYYTIFSVAPLLVIAMGVAGLVFGKDAAQGRIHDQISGLVGSSGAKVIESMMANASKPSTGILATVIGFATLIFGASGVFVQLQQTFNDIWKVKPDKTSGIWAFLRHRLLSFGLVLAIGFVLLVSLAVSAGAAAVGGILENVLPGGEVISHALNFLIGFGVITVLFAMMYKFLPDEHLAWKDTWIGAAITSLLFSIGKFAIGLYLGKSAVAASYGAAGSVAVVLVWVYYAAQILFFGAELTHVYSEYRAGRWNPDAPTAPAKKSEAKAAVPAKTAKPDKHGARPPPPASDGPVPPSTWLPLH